MCNGNEKEWRKTVQATKLGKDSSRQWRSRERCACKAFKYIFFLLYLRNRFKIIFTATKLFDENEKVFVQRKTIKKRFFCKLQILVKVLFYRSAFTQVSAWVQTANFYGSTIFIKADDIRRYYHNQLTLNHLKRVIIGNVLMDSCSSARNIKKIVNTKIMFINLKIKSFPSKANLPAKY